MTSWPLGFAAGCRDRGIVMRSFAKRLVPTTVLRYVRTMLVRRNRRSIVAAGQRQRPLVLVPDNLVEHYYHFLFDLCLPLFLVLEESGSDVHYVIRTTPGPFLDRLNVILGHRISIVESADRRPQRGECVLSGMNPLFVDVSRAELVRFASRVKKALAISDVGSANRVLLIERLPPEGFFVRDAVKKGGGARRRCIANHQEVARAVRAAVGPGFDFCNVQLERMAFGEQVSLFASASVVVGQHGAGLANCVWMEPGATVLEMRHDPGLSHFERLSRSMGHDYHAYRSAGSHAAIPPDELTHWAHERAPGVFRGSST